MDDQATPSVKDQVTAEEWKARCDLAALYRLVHMHGWDDLFFTHISMRVPGPDEHFLLNPFGLLYEDVTASNLVKVDLQGLEDMRFVGGIANVIPCLQHLRGIKQTDQCPALGHNNMFNRPR